MKLAGYQFSAHALDVMAERDIDIAWIARVLEKPDRTARDRVDPVLVHALARITECEGRVLRVVYNASIIPPRIVTAYFDRRQRGKT